MKKQLDYHAKLIIYGLDTMRKADMNRIRGWLLQQANEINKEEYDKRYIARLMK